MFSFGGSSSILSGRHDPDVERSPPPPPTPVTFPSFRPSPFSPVSWTDGSMPEFFKLFSRVRKPSDIAHEHFAALNISLQAPSSLEDLFYTSSDGLECLPPASWIDAPPEPDATPAPPDAQRRLLPNGRPVPDRSDFDLRLKELCFGNQEAFAALSRTPKPGQKPPRLAHFRRFWEALDNMAYYWDTSLDQYIPPETEPAAAETPDSRQSNGTGNNLTHPHDSPGPSEPRKKAKTDSNSDSAESSPPAFPGHTTIAVRPTHPQPTALPSTESTPQQDAPKPEGTYKGNRIGNGAGMPEAYRLAAAQSFVEPVAWSFGLTMTPPRRPPLLAINNLRFPVRVSSAVWRPPNDRARARSGWLEGPALGIQVRSETAFGCGNDAEAAEAEALLDVLREIGGMLELAQERLRAGSERKPGEGEWWTTAPRWGGGPGGEVGDARGEDEVMSAEMEKEKEKENGREKRAKGTKMSAKERRKEMAIESWKNVRPGLGYWDPRVVYSPIGKEPDGDLDEIFFVSSLNTHISILKLSVHRAFLDCISTGSLPSPVPDDPSWCNPTLQRTRWYDLFSIDERKEAMRGVWGMLAYLTREIKPKGDCDVQMGGVGCI